MRADILEGMRALPVITALAATAALAAGCSGDETVVNVTVTQHTGVSVPTTPTAPTTPTFPTTPTAPTTPTESLADLEVRLPPPSVVKSMNSGRTRHLPQAQDMVGALFKTGDPGADAAIRRLESEGYEDGYLRDQFGGSDATSPALVRTYVFRVRDEATARSEVTLAIKEVRQSSTAQLTDVRLEGSYGEGIKATLNGGNRILFVCWASGRDVYGIQVVGKYLHEPDVVKAADQNHLAWG